MSTINRLSVCIDREEFHTNTIDELRNLITGETRDIRFKASSPCYIEEAIFSGYLGNKIDGHLIIMSPECLSSIPSRVTFVTKTVGHDLEHVTASKLIVPFLPIKSFKVPKSVKHIEMTQGASVGVPVDDRLLTLYCHDDLETFIFNCRNVKAHLVDCNNLQKLTVSRTNVYGDFMSYLSSLEILYREDDMVDYLSKFKNLQEYNGYFGREILKHLVGVKKLEHQRSAVNISVDDIPDSVESFLAVISNDMDIIDSDEILAKKPNIKTIIMSGTGGSKEKTSLLLSRYPNVHFHDRCIISEKGRSELINNHNKKLVTLADLCL